VIGGRRARLARAAAGAVLALAAGCGMGRPRADGPVERGGRWSIGLGGMAMEVDPATGGRIVAFRLDGQNLMSGPEVDRLNHGATFWPSPQSLWHWPPPPEIDSRAYGVQLGDGLLVLEGPVSPALGLAVGKRFRADPAAGAIAVEYVMKNARPAVVRLAPWEISRHPPGGLTFFPLGEGGVYPQSDLPVTHQKGVVFWTHDPARTTRNTQLYADGAEGWVAHVQRGLLLLKLWADVPRAQQAPGEGEVELYADGSGTYLEVEQQGPYVAISPGNSTSWTVRWLARALPPDLAAAPGSRALVRWTRALVTASRR
jgi:hypothetical protein